VDNPLRYTQIFETFFLRISVPFDFSPRIPGILGQVDSTVIRLFSRLNSFQIFRKLSKEIFTPFASVSKVRVFLVDGKPQTITGFLLRQAIN